MTEPLRRVLVVDDSAFMRMVLRRIVEGDATMRVIGEARDGNEAVALARELKPDIITMDVEMPERDGLSATRQILSENRPRPAIIMVSGHTQEGAGATIKALSLGAVDFVSKSTSLLPEDLGHIDSELRSKLAYWAHRLAFEGKRAVPKPAPPHAPLAARTPRRRVDLVVVGCSTGGPQTLPPLLTAARPLGAPMVIAQHMPEHFTASLATMLARDIGLDVREGSHRCCLPPGTVTIIPGGRDGVVTVTPAGYELRLTSSESPVHPWADLLFETAATVARQPVAVILTGMGADGSKGAAQFSRRLLPVLVQSPETCVVDGMPNAAIAAGVASELLEPAEIGAKVSRWSAQSYSPANASVEPP